MLFAILAASALGAGFAAYALTHNVLISIGIGLISVSVFMYIMRVSR